MFNSLIRCFTPCENSLPKYSPRGEITASPSALLTNGTCNLATDRSHLQRTTVRANGGSREGSEAMHLGRTLPFQARPPAAPCEVVMRTRSAYGPLAFVRLHRVLLADGSKYRPGSGIAAPSLRGDDAP